jgi:uncharacterized protein
MKKQTPSTPWYREPWPWLLMLGPFVAIIGCAITITLALENFSDQPIYDGGYKRGLVVDRDSAAAPQTR